MRAAGRTIHELCGLPVGEARRVFQQMEFAEEDRPIAAPLLREIDRRLEFLQKVGVDYLTLDRPADTLSGGELQRVRLATSIGSGLVGVCYVLDEPSIGLHPRDNQRLIEAVRDLQRQGNTVVVVEHDEAMMRAADHLIDVGPGAGAAGGRIVAQGPPAEVARQAASLTGRYLSGTEQIPLPPRRRRMAKTRSLVLEGVTTNNLQSVDVRFPLGVLVCVTGVSGSGKSSLVNETLARALTRRLGGVAPKPGPHRSLRGVNQVDKVIRIDQSPIGRTPRSNPATYTGLFDEIRKVFAGTREARQQGYRASRFSFNVKSGRCEACQGHGLRRIEMNFLPDLYVTCDACRAPGSIRRRSESTTGAGRSPTCWDWPSRKRWRSSRTSRPSSASWTACRASGWDTSGWASRRPRCPAAKPSASSWPPNWPAWRPATRCTCWTSPRRACTWTTSAGCWRSSAGWSTAATA